MEALLAAGAEVADPLRLGLLVLGVLIGLSIGVIPGLGGIFGMALLVPFTYTLDPFSAVALLLGMASSTTISDTISAVLLGVPGTAGAMPTVLDGHEMAKNGEAGRALGAAYAAALAGGLFGAAVLAVSIPVLGPVVLALRTPDFLAVGVLGLSAVALLTGRNPLAGIAAACTGVALSFVGLEDQTASQRWTFGQIYLWDGLPLAVVFLGLFGLPELAAVLSRGGIERPGTDTDVTAQDMRAGLRDAVANWPLILRCSGAGAALGALPGLGLSVIGWIVYGLSTRDRRGGPAFGKGNVRGVIGPESAANATEGGTLVPTVALGLPGSASMSILLGALIIQGLTPGPGMLTENASVALTMVICIALANVVGAGICLALTGQLARIARAPGAALVPVALCFVVLGAFRTSASMGDLVILLAFGALGMVMKSLDWSRPALALGFVLGPYLEGYFFVSYQIHGWGLVTRPLMIAVSLAVLAGLALRLTRRSRTGGPPAAAARRLDLGLALPLSFAAVAILISSLWLPFEAAIFPRIAAAGLLASCLAILPMALRAHADSGARDGPAPTPVSRQLQVLTCVTGLGAGLYLIGPSISVLILVYTVMTLQGGLKRRTALITAALTALATYLIFTLAIRVAWPRPALPLPWDLL